MRWPGNREANGTFALFQWPLQEKLGDRRRSDVAVRWLEWEKDKVGQSAEFAKLARPSAALT